MGGVCAFRYFFISVNLLFITVYMWRLSVFILVLAIRLVSSPATWGFLAQCAFSSVTKQSSDFGFFRSVLAYIYQQTPLPDEKGVALLIYPKFRRLTIDKPRKWIINARYCPETKERLSDQPPSLMEVLLFINPTPWL